MTRVLGNNVPESVTDGTACTVAGLATCAIALAVFLNCEFGQCR
jgi:hypothetical protein